MTLISFVHFQGGTPHTHTLERLEALRSQTPDRIWQELFALAVVYNMVRLEMARVAGHLEVSPFTNFVPDQSAADPDIVAQRVGGGCG